MISSCVCPESEKDMRGRKESWNCWLLCQLPFSSQKSLKACQAPEKTPVDDKREERTFTTKHTRWENRLIRLMCDALECNEKGSNKCTYTLLFYPFIFRPKILLSSQQVRFVCRSVEFNYVTLQCHLSEYDRRSPGAFPIDLVDTQGVDYFENACLQCE